MVKRKSFFERNNLLWAIKSIVVLCATIAVAGAGLSAVVLGVSFG